jgi:hypothetical protein
MYTFLAQPWITIRGQTTVTTITQSERCWLDLTPYQDLTAFLECKEVSAGGGTNVQIAYQSAPTKDEPLFLPIVAAFNLVTGATPTVMLKDLVSTPISRWFRWQLTVTGSPSSAWDATFRLWLSANVVGKGHTAAVVAAMSQPGSAQPSVPLHLQPPENPPGLFSSGPVGTQPTAGLNTQALNARGAIVKEANRGATVRSGPTYSPGSANTYVGSHPGTFSARRS